MATYEKRGNSWRVQLCVNGERDSATKRTKAEAVAWAEAREAQLARGMKGDHSLSQAFQQYSDEVSPKKRGRRWEQIRIVAMLRSLKFKDKALDRTTPDDWGKWRDARLKEVSGQSVARELTIASAIYEHARLEWRWTTSNPVREIRWPARGTARKRRVLGDDLKRMMRALGYSGHIPHTANHEVAIAFLLAIETAMRAGELMSLAPSQVHYAERFARLDRTKNGDARDVPLSTEAIRLLKLLPQDGERLFSISSATLDTLFRRARDAAKIEDLHFHDSRREATTRLSKKLNIMELASVTGHRDLKLLHRVYYSADASEIAGKLG